MLDLIERLFERHGIRCLRFDGRMNKDQRDRTLTKFKMCGGPKVILIRFVMSDLGPETRFNMVLLQYEMRRSRIESCIGKPYRQVSHRMTPP